MSFLLTTEAVEYDIVDIFKSNKRRQELKQKKKKNDEKTTEFFFQQMSDQDVYSIEYEAQAQALAHHV